MADGHAGQSQRFRIRSLLLGQSFLSHYFKSWSIDNSRHVLVLTPN